MNEVGGHILEAWCELAPRVTTRDIETDADTERLGKLPMVRGIAPLNRLDARRREGRRRRSPR